LSEEQISFFEAEQAPYEITFSATRKAGLKRLADFAPYAGKAYASKRNYDLGSANRSNISALSPWVRHRLISEEEILQETLKQHSFRTAEKFIQEVFWRSYFKGWLEQRPDVWTWYKQDLLTAINQLEKDSSLNQRYYEATLGQTGIAAFDHWARELVETGYLHNHARMWFASIWIFTLRLPWELGADFFYRHLMDGDPASNTCSWRWVGGLHTKGKNYAASASNIERFTNGRFCGDMKLINSPAPLPEVQDAKLVALPVSQKLEDKTVALLLTEEDNLVETLALNCNPTLVLGLLTTDKRSPFDVGEQAKTFSKNAMQDALFRASDAFQCDTHLLKPDDLKQSLLDLLAGNNIKTLVTAYAPIGPTAEKLIDIKTILEQNNIKFVQILRAYDAMTWPHATKGFFKLKKKMPEFLHKLGIS